MDTKNFKMIDENFICENCHKPVTKLNYTARDHCPNCLYSKHLDNKPGDRKNTCHGMLKPVAIENFKQTYKIVYKCTKCNQIKKNISAKDDNIDKIIQIASNPVEY